MGADSVGPRTTRFSIHLPSRFVDKGTDFTIRIQLFELYLKETGIPNNKKGKELVSLLKTTSHFA